MSAAAHAPARLSVLDGLRIDWARQGMDSLAAALRIVTDLTAQEVALLIGMMRERASLRPSAYAAENAGRLVTGLTGAGKVFLDLAAAESAVMVNGLKEVFGLPAGISAMADLIPKGLETIVEMHKRILDAVAEQTKGIVDAYAEGKPLMPAARMARMARTSIESFIETQKVFLDEVAQQVTIATGGPEKKAARRDRSKILVQLAQEGIDKFIDAQKQVLDLTVEEMERANGHAKTKPSPKTSIGELTRKSVQNFTEAQKSLLDLALKPGEDAEEAPKARTARRKPRPRKRSAVTAEATA